MILLEIITQFFDKLGNQVGMGGIDEYHTTVFKIKILQYN